MHQRRAFVVTGLTVACVLFGAAAAEARAGAAFDPKEAQTPPPEVANVGIDDKAGSAIPKDIVLRDGDGRVVPVAELFDGKRPVVLALAYYSCPMLCTLVLNGLADGLKQVKWNAGAEYRVVSVSIDPRDTSEVAKGKEENYAADYGRAAAPDAWRFLVGDERNVRRLADAVGFRYRWDEESRQYAHAAGAFVLTPDGRVSRTLYGVQFQEKDLRLALVEASQGSFASTIDKITLYCFTYDPHSKGYVLAAMRLMKAGAVTSVLALGTLVAVLFRRERSARAAKEA